MTGWPRCERWASTESCGCPRSPLCGSPREFVGSHQRLNVGVHCVFVSVHVASMWLHEALCVGAHYTHVTGLRGSITPVTWMPIAPNIV